MSGQFKFGKWIENPQETQEIHGKKFMEIWVYVKEKPGGKQELFFEGRRWIEDSEPIREIGDKIMRGIGESMSHRTEAEKQALRAVLREFTGENALP